MIPSMVPQTALPPNAAPVPTATAPSPSSVISQALHRARRAVLPRKTTIPLVNCVAALFMVLNTALDSRAEKGEQWLVAASASRASFDMSHLVRMAPKPMLTTCTAAQFGRMYRGALDVVLSPFDLLNGTTLLVDIVNTVIYHTGVAPSATVIACVYIDRLTAAVPHMFVTRTNIQRLFAVAFMIATKWLEDEAYPPGAFADLFGVPAEDFGRMERWFAAAIGYNFFVSTEQFHDAQLALMAEALDSPSGLQVFQALLEHKVAMVHKAFDMAETWRKNSAAGAEDAAMAMQRTMDQASALVTTEEDEHCMDDILGPSSLERERRWVRGQHVVQELAKAQRDHDFSYVPHAEKIPARHWMRYFTEKGLARYAKLDAIIRDEWVEDLVLPPLEYPEIPSFNPPRDPERTTDIRDSYGSLGLGSLLVDGATVSSVASAVALGYSPPPSLGIWQYVPPRNTERCPPDRYASSSAPSYPFGGGLHHDWGFWRPIPG
ncbi:Cyclin [Gracilaria domingensis]|nr:Cyclin [Gracilaria domingensis]